MTETVDARKERIDADAAWEMVKGAGVIHTGKGKKRRSWDPSKDAKADILKDIMGPSGNLRAPCFRIGDDFVVGFNPELYEDQFEG